MNISNKRGNIPPSRHNYKKIESIIYNNVYNIGNTKKYKYKDKIIDDIIYYSGQNSGRCDHLIKEKRTLYLEKHRGQEYIYIGLVDTVEKVETYPINIFKLKIDKTHIQNGFKSGDKLNYIDGLKKGKGSYWAKRSSIINLGFKDIGNMCSGIIKI